MIEKSVGVPTNVISPCSAPEPVLVLAPDFDLSFEIRRLLRAVLCRLVQSRGGEFQANELCQASAPRESLLVWYRTR